MTEKTPKQVAADKAAEAKAKADAKAAAAAAKEAEQEAKKAAAKAEREAKAAAKKAEREAAAAAKKAAAEKAKADRAAAAVAKKAEQEAKKAAAKAKREAERMPEQNGVRRPKPKTLCGEVWAIADKLSANLGQPVPIADLLKACEKKNHNPGNVKAEYARWRKFNGVTGRVSAPSKAA